MDDLSYNHVLQPPLHRTRTLAKLLMLGVLAVGSLATFLLSSLFSSAGSTTDNSSYFRSPRNFPRSLQDNLTCTVECCQQFEEQLCPSENEWINAIPFAMQIILIIVLLCLSALFSGLTLGLMSLDCTGLEIVMSGEDPKEKAYAEKIYPVRSNGNLLLCTLLLGNVAVNALLSIFLAAYAGGITGFIASTFSIVIFGEIVPQALCSRYALRIGALTVPLVKAIRFVLYPISAPLAWCLDKALGRELATTYSNAEMMKLLQIHVEEQVIDKETAGAMTGALTYKKITVKEVMTPLERTFMLNVDDKLSFETITRIFKTGYSRIPVYEVSKDNVMGLLFVKDLIFVDPQDEVPIRSFIQIFGRSVHHVWPDDSLGTVLTELKNGRSHLALVRDVNNADESQDPFYELKGIITLEDIVEKIIGNEIVDETDAFLDGDQKIKVERTEAFEWARLRLLDSKIVDASLSESEVQAVTAHFRMNYPDSVKLLTDAQLERLVAKTKVSMLPTAEREVGKALPTDLLYKKGEVSNECTLLLGGKVTILVGSENFRSDVSAWSVLGRGALENANFVPDFTAYVSDGPCKCLRFQHASFVEAVDASTVERRVTEGKLASIHRPEEIAETGDGNDAVSTSSASAPNRREKVIAKILKTDSQRAPTTSEDTSTYSS